VSKQSLQTFSCKIHGNLLINDCYIKDGKPYACRTCVKARMHAKYLEKRCYILEYQKAYVRKNHAKIKKYKHKYQVENKGKLSKIKHEYYEKNVELIKSRIRKYRVENAEAVFNRGKKYREKHRQELSNQKKIYRAVHATRIKEIKKRHALALRIEAINKYSDGSMTCAACGNNNFSHLCLDHINGGGTQHRKEGKVRGKAVYQWVKKNNYPPIFQVLCYNCNFIKSLKPCDNESKSRKCCRLLKHRIISHYSNGVPKCQICKNNDMRVLTIDHISKGGRQHLTALNIKGGTQFYRYLEKNRFPSGYRVLCFNCNCCHA